ncbi:hypothetical protein AX17_004025 [Amanita inopinata Kibby_2008]|nr:hypothetical protein AX17_004025 [Amanita inopinata Kibby_2008]
MTLKTSSKSDPNIIQVIRNGLFPSQKEILVVDTHQKGEFRADISFAFHANDNVPYSLLYCIELKFPGPDIDTAENCGQVLNYFNEASKKQPLRITKERTTNFADALTHADKLSRSQYINHIPEINKIFPCNYTTLAASSRHFIFSLPRLEMTVESASRPATRDMNSRKTPAHESWHKPSWHKGKNKFALKIAHGGNSVANEIKILKKLGETECHHVPEIVWAPEGGKELGIVPVGDPIDFTEPAIISRRIVEGLIEGLEFLHKQDIIHRDISVEDVSPIIKVSQDVAPLCHKLLEAP